MHHSTAAPHDGPATATRSRLGRLGAWAADHRRAIAIAWCGVVLVLGALAPFADRALSGAGWEALDSESVAARDALEARFPGRGSYALSVVVAGPRAGIDDPPSARPSRVSRPSCAATRRCRACSRRRQRRATAAARSSSAWRARAPDEMVEAAGRLKDPPRAAVGAGRRRPPHGTRRDVVGLQRGQQGGDAQVRAAVLAADARAAGVRVRHARRRRPAAAAHDGRPARRGRAAVRVRAVRRRVDLGDELRDDVRDRARDRLRALHRRPLPLRARRGARTARGDGASRWRPRARRCS